MKNLLNLLVANNKLKQTIEDQYREHHKTFCDLVQKENFRIPYDINLGTDVTFVSNGDKLFVLQLEDFYEYDGPNFFEANQEMKNILELGGSIAAEVYIKKYKKEEKQILKEEKDENLKFRNEAVARDAKRQAKRDALKQVGK